MREYAVRTAVLLWFICLPFQAAVADNLPFREQVVVALGADDTDGLVKLAGKTIYGTPTIRLMYRATAYAPIWNEKAIGALSTALDDIEQDGLIPGDYRFAEIEAQLRAPDLSALTAGQAAELDILLTEAFLRAVYNLYFGKADPESVDPNINFARATEGDKSTPLLLEHITRTRIDEAFAWARPQSAHYERLRSGLARYRTYQAAGGWEVIPSGASLKPGTTDARVALVRRRLAVTDDLPDTATASANPEQFDATLQDAVKRFQARHGLEADGVVGAGTLAAMNVPVEARIDQIRVNLERERWILHEAHDEYLVADIAGFEVYWAREEDTVWQEQIQVGKEYTKTPVFGGKIRYLEFNPTWTVPPGILRRSVIPGLIKDPGYLDRKGYQLLTQDGKPVDPYTVDWKSLNGFPYIVRQPPGPNNALGHVKFIFPNPHFVFLHDTNHREFFDRSKRTFSSGCIRVRNPFDLAERLLADQEGWNRARIDAVIGSGKTTRVFLAEPMRVFITYNTARAPADDVQVHFRADVYRRDPPVLASLDGPFRLRRRDRRGG